MTIRSENCYKDKIYVRYRRESYEGDSIFFATLNRNDAIKPIGEVLPKHYSYMELDGSDCIDVYEVDGKYVDTLRWSKQKGWHS